MSTAAELAARRARLRYGITIGMAAASGFIALSYEIVWYRAFAFVSWGHPTVFGLMLGFYLFGVAFGALGSRPFCKTTAGGVADDRRALRALAGFVFLANCVSYVVVPSLGWFAKTNWLWGFGTVALGAGLMGAVLPLVAHFGIPADDRAGSRLSYVYLANIIGSSSGSFLTGFVLMDAWSTPQIAMTLALVGFGMVAVLLALAAPARNGAIISLVATGAIAAVALTLAPRLYDRLYERLLWKRVDKPDLRLAHVLENRHGVIAVNDYGQIYGGGAYDGAFNVSLVDDKNVIERAFAVQAMHPAPKRVLLIGLSSGSWAQIVSNLRGVEAMTVIEINPGYMELIAKFPAVRSLLTNPKVNIVVDDGRRWLQRHPDEKFDFIVMNTTYHWRAHCTNLLSQEFLQLARSHLLPGGIHYFNTTSSHSAQRTAATVFPHALRVINFVAVSDSPIPFDRQRWKEALTETRIDGEVPLDLGKEKDVELLRRFMQFAETIDGPPVKNGLERRDSLLESTKDGVLVTDDNLAVEWGARFKFPLTGDD